MTPRARLGLSAAVLTSAFACGTAGPAGETTYDPLAGAPVSPAASGPATPDVDRCPLDEAGDAWSPAAPAVVAVGDFIVSLAAIESGGAVAVEHRAGGGNVLFATPPGRILRAARAALHVEERQGSFTVDDRDTLACDGARIEDVALAPGRLRVRGRLGGPGACGDVAFTVGFCQARPGHLVFDARVSDASFGALTLETRSDPGERIYGLGEQFRHESLDLKGAKVSVLSQEGGIGRGHLAISPAVNLISRGSAGSEETTYYAAPHVLTSRRRSFFLENTELATFDFTDRSAIRVRTHAPRVRGRILHGRTPLELIERFTEYAGRMPPLPDWANEGAIVALARELDEVSRSSTRSARAERRSRRCGTRRGRARRTRASASRCSGTGPTTRPGTPAGRDTSTRSPRRA